MADDPGILWTLANSFGIWKNGNSDEWNSYRQDTPADQWNSGRATDILVRRDGNLVIATDRGGIWLMSDSADGTVCVSDRWEDAGFLSLAQGPDGAEHVFAGGVDAALYTTNLSQPLPMLDWVRLDSLRKIAEVGTVRDIAVLDRSRVVVLACDGGMFWSRIPSPPSGSSFIDEFQWSKAVVDGNSEGGFYSVAAGPVRPGLQVHPVGPIAETVMAGGLGNATAGLFWGQWEDEETLLLKRSDLFQQTALVTPIGFVTQYSVVTSSVQNRNIGYAACPSSFDDSLLVLFSTEKGGRSWTAIDPKLPGFDLTKRFADAFGVSQGGRNICIAVSNNDPEIVALGMQQRTAISFDGGQTWRKPGFDPTQAIRITDHLHDDVSNVAFAIPRSGTGLLEDAVHPMPSQQQSYYVSSDGGIANIRWGDGAWVIESDVTEGEHPGNLYAVALDGTSLMLYVRHSGGAKKLQWESEAVITSNATGAGCLIQSTFASGDSANGNLEVIVPEGNELVHYWCPISNNKYTDWSKRTVISSFATGPGSFTQSSMGTGPNGNFEAVVLEGNELVHYWRDNGTPSFTWHKAATISTKATSAGCVIQSNFASGNHGNLEIVVLEDKDLVHYWHDSSSPGSAWMGPNFIHQADSSGCFFQSNYVTGSKHANFELVFLLDKTLMHCFRDNSATGEPWSNPVPLTEPGRKASGPGCVIQGNYGSDATHGNFELLVPEGASVVHYFRDNSETPSPWKRTIPVTESAISFRSDYNRKLATLQFYAPFGASMVAAGALVGPMQDNGILDGLAGDSGTPWFQLEEGDGAAAFYLSGRSPKIPGGLAAGFTAVHENNEPDVDKPNIKGSKSSHLIGDQLTPDNHGKGGDVIPLLIPKPGTSLPPELGLRPGSGSAIQYAVVRSPENFPKSLILAALAVQDTDLYALLVGQNIFNPNSPRESLDMHWEYMSTLDSAKKVNAFASADGLTVIVEMGASESKLLTSELGFFRFDLTTGAIVSMPLDPAIGTFGSAASIDIVSPNEAYAAVNGTGPIPFLGPLPRRILCWDGNQWVERGQPTIPKNEGNLISIVVDPTQNPATIFAATGTKVYISRDSARTWTRASLGLPAAVPCQTLQWVHDGQGSHVYMATFGRSVWGIHTKDKW